MNNDIKIIANGFADDINILNADEMDEIMGGDVDCKRKFVESHVECHQRYTEVDGKFTCKKNFKWTE